MPDIREIVKHNLEGPKGQTETEKIGEVEKTAKDMTIIGKTMQTARELSGAEDLERQAKEAREEAEKRKDQLDRERQERNEKEQAEMKDLLKKALERGDMPQIKELEHKLEESREASRREQVEGLRHEIGELRKMKERNTGDFADEIKKVKAAGIELGLGPKGPEMPADIMVQLKKMEIESARAIEEMRDARSRRDAEWDLDKMKYVEEREMRKQEIEGKMALEREKISMLSQFGEGLGKTIFKAAQNSEGGIAAQNPQTKVSAQAIEAGEGEFGEVPCSCGGSIPVAHDSIRAICPRCTTIFPVKRVAKAQIEQDKAEAESEENIE